MENKDVAAPVYLSADDILNAQDITTIDVEVPEWGGIVRLRTLSAEEAVGFADELKANPKTAPVRILVQSAVDKDGKQLFTVEKLEALSKKSVRAVKRIQDAALELNGLTEKKAAEVKNG